MTPGAGQRHWRRGGKYEDGPESEPPPTNGLYRFTAEDENVHVGLDCIVVTLPSEDGHDHSYKLTREAAKLARVDGRCWCASVRAFAMRGEGGGTDAKDSDET